MGAVLAGAALIFGGNAVEDACPHDFAVFA